MTDWMQIEAGVVNQDTRELLADIAAGLEDLDQMLEGSPRVTPVPGGASLVTLPEESLQAVLRPFRQLTRGQPPEAEN